MLDLHRKLLIRSRFSRGGAGPRRKGNRAERVLVRYLQDRGFRAKRVPLSGSMGGSFAGDISAGSKARTC
jgi:Holliday junction resolvase